MAEEAGVSVGSLELQIKSDAEQASRGISHLADSLAALKTAVSAGAALESVGHQLTRLVTLLNSASADFFTAPMERMTKGLTELAEAANKLKGVEGVVGKVIRAATGSGKAGANMTGMASTLPEITQAVEANMGAAQAGGAAIAESLANTANTASEAQQEVRGVAGALKDVGAAAAESTSSVGKNLDGVATAASHVEETTIAPTVDTTSIETAGEKIKEVINLAGDMHRVNLGNGVSFEWVGSLEDGMRLLNEAAAAGKYLQQDFMSLMTVISNADWDARGLAKAFETGADVLRVEEAESNKVTENLADASAKAKEAQANILGMANALKDAAASSSSGSGSVGDAKPEIDLGMAYMNAMLKYADDLLSTGELNANQWKAVGAEIRNINWAEGTKSLSDIMGPSEGHGWVMDLSHNLDAERAEAERAVAETGTGVEATTRSMITLESVVSRVGTVLRTASAGFRALKDAIFGARGGLLGFLHGMTRMAKYRMFRSLIRHISEGFTTGLKNLREYSKAVDNLYNKDMTGLDNSVLKMKNSLGAALGSALQSLIPLFQQLTQWVITAANYVNQFIALMSGRTTWTRAMDVVAADYEKTKNNAKGAAKETKNLLAAWDELNIIQSKNGNNGSGNDGNTTGDYSKMFEEVNGFSKEVQDVAGWFKLIADNAAAIGIALATWKIGSVLIPSLLGISTVLAGIVGVLSGGAIATITIYLDYKFMTDYLQNGNYQDLVAANVVSGIGAALTGMLVGKAFKSTEAGLVTAGAVLTVTGVMDIVLAIGNVNAEGINQENINVAASGAVKTALGASFIGASVLNGMYKASGKGPLSLKQGAGIALMAGAIVAGIVVDAMLVAGEFKEGDDGNVDKILESLASTAASTATAALGGWMFGGKEWAATAAGATLTAIAVVDLIAGMGNVIENGVTMDNIATLLKGALGVGIGASLLANNGIGEALMYGMGFRSKYALGMVAFGLVASVSISAMVNKEALKEGSMASMLASTVTDAFTSTMFGIGVAKATGNAKTGVEAAGITLAIQGGLNFIATLKDIQANGFTEERTANLVSKALETALGIGLTVGVYTGNAVLGIVAGALTLAVEGIGLILTATAQKVKLLSGNVTLSQEEIDAAIGTYFNSNITMNLTVVKAKINKADEARTKVRAKLTELQGGYTIWVRTGLKKLEGTELENFCNDVGEVVTEINNTLSEEQSIIKLSLGMYTTDEDGKEVLTNLSQGLTARQGLVNKIGQQIGKWLKEGTIDQYQDVIPEMLEILESAAGLEALNKSRSEFKTNAILARNRFENGDLTAESFTDYVKSYVAERTKATEQATAQTSAELEIAMDNLAFYREYKKDPAKYEKYGYHIDNIDEEIQKAEATVRELQDSLPDRTATRVAQIVGDEEDKFKDSFVRGLMEKFPVGFDVDAFFAHHGESTAEILSNITGIDVDTLKSLEKSGVMSLDWLWDTLYKYAVSRQSDSWTYEGKATGPDQYVTDVLDKLGINSKYFQFDRRTGGLTYSGTSDWKYGNVAIDLKELAKLGYSLQDLTKLEPDKLIEVLDAVSTGKYSWAQMYEYQHLKGKGQVEATEAEVLKTIAEKTGLKEGSDFTIVDLGDGNAKLRKNNGYENWIDESLLASMGFTMSDILEYVKTASAEDVQDFLNFLFDNAGGAWRQQEYQGGSGVVGGSSSGTVNRGVEGLPTTEVTPPGAPGFDNGEEEDSATGENQKSEINLLNQILTAATAIMNKDFTVALRPSATLGQTVNESMRMYERTRG